MRPRPLPDDLLRELARRFGTPLYVYRWETVLERLSSLGAFDVVRYAQKANAGLELLRRLRAEGVLVDAVSVGEVRRALEAGWEPRQIVYTADLFTREALELVAAVPVRVNAGSADMLEQLAAVRPGAAVTLRINPGFGAGHAVKVNTGGIWSKHGIWHEHLPEVLATARAAGLEVEGLHVHIGSGADMESHERSAHTLLELASAVGPSLRTISAGGGLPVAYRAGDPELDLERYGRAWSGVRDELARRLGRPVELETEPGRYLVAESGVLLAEVRAAKRMGPVEYVLVDAGFHTLVRPAMYGAFHRLSVVGKDHLPTAPRVVAGPLCESADVFTQDRDHRPTPQDLPPVEVGDLLCVHDAGAYGASMASGYNSQLLPAEVLVEEGRATLVRRRQTYEELVAPERDLQPRNP